MWKMATEFEESHKHQNENTRIITVWRHVICFSNKVSMSETLIFFHFIIEFLAYRGQYDIQEVPGTIVLTWCFQNTRHNTLYWFCKLKSIPCSSSYPVLLKFSKFKHMKSYHNEVFEPRHDKTNKMTVRPAKTQIRLIWVFARTTLIL